MAKSKNNTYQRERQIEIPFGAEPSADTTFQELVVLSSAKIYLVAYSPVGPNTLALATALAT